VFGALGLRPGLRLLDVGCGTGDYLRVMAPLVAPGQAIGIDLSAELVKRAELLSRGEQPNMAFQVADVYDLPFADASFERVTATQVMVHLSYPWTAIRELRRVLVPGGRLAIAEWDWDSTCLAVTDRDLGRRFTHLLCDRINNGLIARELASELVSPGFNATSGDVHRAGITSGDGQSRAPADRHVRSSDRASSRRKDARSHRGRSGVLVSGLVPLEGASGDVPDQSGRELHIRLWGACLRLCMPAVSCVSRRPLDLDANGSPVPVATHHGSMRPPEPGAQQPVSLRGSKITL
jgi:SAM-dependent methyltransferase